jgi:hypothetical protein
MHGHGTTTSGYWLWQIDLAQPVSDRDAPPSGADRQRLKRARGHASSAVKAGMCACQARPPPLTQQQQHSLLLAGARGHREEEEEEE